MGTFKKFRAGLSLEELQTNLTWDRYTNVTVTTCYSIAGNSTNKWYIDQTMNQMKAAIPYAGLIPVATADDIANYDVEDYQISGVGTTTYSTARSVAGEKSYLTFTVTITNNTGSDITVKCVKFKKSAFPSDQSKEYLVCAYYLDQSEWVTIPNGSTDVIVVVQEIG